MNRVLSTLAVVMAIAVGFVTPMAAAGEESDPFEGALFTPEEVMRHQSAVDLSKEQRDRLIAEVTQAQADFLPAQMELAEHAEELKRQVAAPRIDEQAALAVATRLLELESQIKRRHLELAIRIKNLLDESQQARLAGLRVQG